MKRQLSSSFLVVLFFVSVQGSAQKFQGKAIYKSARKQFAVIKNDSTDHQKQAEISSLIAKAFQKEYTLVFNRNESIFKENESLEKPNPGNEFTITTSTPFEHFYKNTKENRVTIEREIFGKRFLIKDSLQVQPWRILNETKRIGEYSCTKAVVSKTYKKRVVNDDGSFNFIDEEKDLIVWFTYEIPISHGPANFYGLPGLVLEVEDGRSTFLCTKIVLNLEEVLEIKEPRKGKVVSQAEFDEIRSSKFKEMKTNFPRKNRNR